MIVYQPGKADILADALSRSKWVELDAIHNMMIEGDQIEEIAVMTRSSIVATKEVKIWRTAQEEDPIVQDTIQRMRQRHVRSAFALTPQGLLVQEDQGQQKLVVPTSMRQKVLASCYDEPTKGHPSVHRTTELDTGGRTVQALPRETQVNGQDWHSKNYKLQRGNVIISLPYIG